VAILPNVPPIKVYWHNPAPVFSARVNLASPIYPIQDIPYDGVTVGAYTDLAADMLFTLGSTPGGDEYGRGRLRAAPTSTILKVGRSSQGTEDGQLEVVNDAYITVYDDFRVWSKIATIQNFVEYKDTDIAVGDHTEKPPPVANMGPDRAWRIDASTGKARFYFSAFGSFAVADGATIVGFAWDIGDGSFALGSVATDSGIYADFGPGVRYVALTVTDSNGKTHTSRRLVLADDPANSLCVSGMQAQNITRNQQGFTARVRTLVDLPRADYPDGAHVLIWKDHDPAIHGSPDPTDVSNLLFTGWHQSDQASSRALETHLQKETQLTCVDVLGRLDTLPGWDQRVEVPTEEDLEEDGMNWGYMPAANMDKFLCYLIHWHSTAASVADFYPSGTWDEYPFVLFDSAGDTLYSQLQRQANRIVPDHNFTSDRFGAMRVIPNPQFQNPADRTSVIQNSLTVQAWSEIDFGYQRPPRVHTTHGSALRTQTEWIINEETGEKELENPVFSIAPGTAPGQGAREVTLGERLAKSQDDLNDCVGHHHAHENARYGSITVTLNLNADPWDFDPAAHTWVYLVTTSESAPQRGIDFETTRCLCKEVSIDYQYSEEGTTWRGRVGLEVETVGLPALTEEQEPALPVGEQPSPPPPEPLPTQPPSYGLLAGSETVAAFGIASNKPWIFRTNDFQTPASSGGPEWEAIELVGLDTTGWTVEASSFPGWVVDPFSPGYRGTGTEINAFICTRTYVYKLINLFGTPILEVLHTFPVLTGSRTIGASFGRFFPNEADNPWLMVLTNYSNTPPYREWVTYSVDGGQTWSDEVKVSTYASTSQVAQGNPRALYMSPKTPGYAITHALTNTNGLVHTHSAHFTTDWGATWSLLTDPPIDPLHSGTPGLHVPWHDNDDEAIVYYGSMTRLSSPTRWQFKTKRIMGGAAEDISPSPDGVKHYGPHQGQFSIRAFDSDRRYLAMAGRESDAGFFGSDVNWALWVSDDYGDTWTLAGPGVINNSMGSYPQEVAFGGDSKDVLYAWGLTNFIRYSSNFGATFDSRQGNIMANGNVNILGIAGGPTV
jgi:hypothetical protein